MQILFLMGQNKKLLDSYFQISSMDIKFIRHEI